MTKLVRLDEARSRVSGLSVDAILYATEQVETDRASIKSLGLLDRLSQDVERLRSAQFLGADAGVDRAVLTPDFHRGARLPVGIALALKGVVVPGAIGNDIGCGMSFAVLEGVASDEVISVWPKLAPRLRHAFFQGGRTILAEAETRQSLLSEGFAALESGMLSGVWEDVRKDIGASLAANIHDPFGQLTPGSPFEEWIAPSGQDGFTRDQLLGTIGGGNHFVELQHVTDIVDGGAAWRWGLAHGAVGVMVHSGSVGLGRAVANVHSARLRARFPKGLRQPEEALMPFPTTGWNADLGLDYLMDMAAAARFAATNRLVLSLMARRALSEVLNRPIGWRLVHDLPHNLIWQDQDGTVLHRKGACPALGSDGTDTFAMGMPVIVPGSMGTASALLKGTGNPDCLASAPHGAGRVLSRNAARATVKAVVPRVVTPVDLRHARDDIRKDADRRLAEEAPRAYKPIGPVIDTMVLGEMATEVARLAPLITVKG